MGKRIDAETRAAIVEAHSDGASYRAIAQQFGVSYVTAQRIVLEYQEAGNNLRPKRIQKPETAPDWMEHITPLHRHKQELENAIAHKQAELDAARQEYRDFLATLEQLMKEEV